MRTGYMDTLLSSDPNVLRRQEEEELVQRQKFEAEQRQVEEHARKAAEEAKNKANASKIASERAEAEKQALERRKQQQERKLQEDRKAQQSSKMARKAHDSDSDDDDMGAACGGGFMSSSMLTQQIGRTAPAAEQPVTKPLPAEEPKAPDPVPAIAKELEPVPVVTATKPEAVVPIAVEPQSVESVRKPSDDSTSKDAVSQALMALRKRYRESDPSALETCLRTLSSYLGNLARNPHEAKFQRINCENTAFKTRVSNLEGATAVLEACGFRPEGNQLAVDVEFVKSNPRHLWDAQSKLDVLLGQMKPK